MTPRPKLPQNADPRRDASRASAVDDGVSAACSVAVVAIVRILSVRYRLVTSPARGFRALDD